VGQEVWNRGRSLKEVLHKISYIRNKNFFKTFLFVFPRSIPPETDRALRAEGVMPFPVLRFADFLERLSSTLHNQPSLPEPDDREDRAMISDASAVPCFLCRRFDAPGIEAISVDGKTIAVCWQCRPKLLLLQRSR
jgi:hypothetical protein